MATITIQMIRYINLLDGISKVKTSKCYLYNNAVIFAVPRALLSRALGPGATNIKYMQDKLGKRVRIIKEASGAEDAERFVRDLVAPVGFNSLELKDGEFVLTAGMQSKAALIGRNRRRLEELDQIIKDTFGVGLRIV